MANEKSIFKKAVCPSCRNWKPDTTGKAKLVCACGSAMALSSKWYVRLTRQGKTITKSVSTRKQDAVDYVHTAKAEVSRGGLLPGEEKGISWESAKEALEKWIDSPAADLAPKTKEFYANGLKHLDRFFDGYDLQAITVRLVEEYRDGREAAAKSICEEIKLLKRIFSLHCRWHSARIAPTLHAVAADLAKVEMPKYNNKRTRFLSDLEVTALLGQCKQAHLKLAVSIALRTGLRLNNIMAMQYKQINFEERTISYEVDDMKSKRLFVLPIMQTVADDLQAWRKSRKKLSPYVFPCPRDLNKPMRRMQTSFFAAAKAAKLGDDVVFHTLRHTYASQFLMKGGDLATLSELLDHASIQITKDRYGHLSGEHKKKAVDEYAKLMNF